MVEALHCSGSQSFSLQRCALLCSWRGSRDWFSIASRLFEGVRVPVTLFKMGPSVYIRDHSIHARAWSVCMYHRYWPKLLLNLLQLHFRTHCNVPAHYFVHLWKKKSKQIRVFWESRNSKFSGSPPGNSTSNSTSLRYVKKR